MRVRARQAARPVSLARLKRSRPGPQSRSSQLDIIQQYLSKRKRRFAMGGVGVVVGG